MITLTETLIILDITKKASNNCFIIHWTKKKIEVMFFTSLLTASNTKCANLTWLPLEIMHRGHTWHDYPWPWVSLTWLLYNLQFMTSRALISKIHCTLSANQKRVREVNEPLLPLHWNWINELTDSRVHDPNFVILKFSLTQQIPIRGSVE